jgi:23S rRNA (cytosine1962-C5)-methyltransferase
MSDAALAVDAWHERLWPHWRPQWVVHRDEALLVVDKPAGMPLNDDGPDDARGGPGDLLGRVRAWLRQQRPTDSEPYVALLHGFDRDASGLVVLSLDKAANRSLAQQFEGGVARRYLAAVATLGRLSQERRGKRKAPRGRARGRKVAAVDMQHRVLQRSGKRMLLAVDSRARSQPVRRWLAQAGAPLAGDGDGEGPAARRLLLHAAGLELEHPLSGATLQLEAPTPPSFEHWLAGGSAEPEPIDRLLREAADRRYLLGRRADTDAFRLVHEAGDGLDDVAVDVYARHAVLFVKEQVPAARCDALLDAIASLGFDGVYIKRRPRRANVTQAEARDALVPPEPQRGRSADSPLVVHEAGVAYPVRLDDGLSTGLFMDQRVARRWVQDHAADRSVLNLFAHHGAFTLAALAGGASASVTLDSSGAILDRARENLAFANAGPAHELVRAEARDWCRASERRFDLVILDPPSYSVAGKRRFRAEQDYAALAAAAMHCLADGGVLLACTNHRGIVRAAFRRQLAQAAKLAGRQVERMTELSCPADFPPPPGGECHLKTVLVFA